ncbi:MAG: MupA/Atu3671 family FMN-dependent luciferase-like monooxygenase [Pseudomonadota bacterium]|nr:MupA/Atu3671 family FMN-dependent luciferase-like monooxygenase [Pseudomonadota bacterium]
MDDTLIDRLSALSSRKRALLEARLRNRQGRTHAPASEAAVLKKEEGVGASHDATVARAPKRLHRPITFSCFFFSDDGATQRADKYNLLIKCARFADRNGFEAVWTPERHFKPFGGLYPNPSVLSGALAMITERIAIRAGSVVLPLHDPLRAAEEWSVVDNLSGGRTGIAIASGWHPDDFALVPESYERRRELAFEHIQMLRRLWNGETVERRNGVGATVALRIYPNPIQAQLPLWLTAMSERSFVEAGRIGAHVLTGLMDQDVGECARRISLYRRARTEHGFDPDAGRVALMVHTYIGNRLDEVRALVREPMIEYLRSFLAASEDQLRARTDVGAVMRSSDEDDFHALLDHAFGRYFETRSLMGTQESCGRMVRVLSAIGVDELACLLDFGLDHATVLDGLDDLNELRRATQESVEPGGHPVM